MYTSKNFLLKCNLYPEKHTQHTGTAHKLTTLLEASPRNKMRHRTLPETISRDLPIATPHSREGAFQKCTEPGSDVHLRSEYVQGCGKGPRAWLLPLDTARSRGLRQMACARAHLRRVIAKPWVLLEVYSC